MSERLKNCPFCGKYPQTVVDDETEEKFGVKCFNCGGMIYPEKATLQEAIEAWNRRVPVKDEERKELAERWKALCEKYPAQPHRRRQQGCWDVMENGEHRWAERRKNEPDWGV